MAVIFQAHEHPDVTWLATAAWEKSRFVECDESGISIDGDNYRINHAQAAVSLVEQVSFRQRAVFNHVPSTNHA